MRQSHDMHMPFVSNFGRQSHEMHLPFVRHLGHQGKFPDWSREAACFLMTFQRRVSLMVLLRLWTSVRQLTTVTCLVLFILMLWLWACTMACQ